TAAHSLVAPRAAGHLLSARAAHRARAGWRRHQAVPRPRSRPPPRTRRLDVGPQRRDGDRHAPDDRLPVPDGPVVLALPPLGRARLGGTAPLARDVAVRGGHRRAVPAPHARGAPYGGVR